MGEIILLLEFVTSLYHKSEDLLKMPSYLKEYVPEHRFYLRNYNTL